MDKIDWYYIYSQRYYPYDLYLQEAIPATFFQAKGIFIDQSVFDKDLYKHAAEHFFSRITVKVETILKLIQEKRVDRDEQPFFFTDVDIIIKPHATEVLPAYTRKEGMDMIFQQEYNEGLTANPGVILIWPTAASEDFWSEILRQMREVNTMEMICINSLLKQNTVHWDFFSLQHVCSPITVKQENIATFCLYHLLAGANDRFTDLQEKLVQAKLLVEDFEKYYRSAKEKYGANFL